MKILVTGGSGFIGSNLIHKLLKNNHKVVNIDLCTYASNYRNFKGLNCNFYSSDPINIDRYDLNSFMRDIAEPGAIEQIICDYGPFDAILNLAAETHVDRSIESATKFVKTNVQGTLMVLEAARKHNCRLVHISTDEVYGEIRTGSFSENSQLDPRNPYAATKAGADLLVLSYCKTYAINAAITRCSNNYGPRQHPEKFLSKAITNLIDGIKIPVYGDGLNERDWIHVDDHCSGIILVLESGKTGEIFNFGREITYSNLDMIKMVCLIMGKEASNVVEFVPDRLGHDYRYSVNYSKARSQLKWQPAITIDKGLAHTIDWYQKNEDVWKPIKSRI